MKLLPSLPGPTRYQIIPTAIIGIFVISMLAYAQTSPTIRNNVYVDNVHVGGMTRNEAYEAVQSHLASREEPNLTLVIENKPYPITPRDIDLAYNTTQAVEGAWRVARSGNPLRSLFELASLTVTTHPILLRQAYSDEKLHGEIATIAELVDEPLKDLRLHIDGSEISILSDTKKGYMLDQRVAFQTIAETIERNQTITPSVDRQELLPDATMESAERAKEQAERIIAGSVELRNDKNIFTVSPGQIGAWIQTVPEGQSLNVAFDEPAVGAYVTTIAAKLDAEPRAPRIQVDASGKVSDFVTPRTGKRLDQEKTIRDILSVLTKRRDDAADTNESAISPTFAIQVPDVTYGSAAELGIIELIGTATTPLTGSPQNRRYNIANGAKFLTGILIPPNEEFSTLKSLGTIDNSTGYLPELVIKGDRTIPEFGGGLCQVSTTLFRATLNAGLPITARQNHSYRVSYYEKDAAGNTIGPGLDATIYNPAPDFRFKNDPGHTVLIEGYVEGDLITFNFYGTRDGRSSAIDGPHLLSSSPAGEPIYAETDTLEPGVTKQIERAHAGGSATATYTVTYPDGSENKQVFESYYRPWPARYLVGADPSKATTTESMSNQ